MSAILVPSGGPAGVAGAVVRARPTHRELETFALAHLPGITKAKARRLARRCAAEPNPYEAILGRQIESAMLRGHDPTGDIAVRRVRAQERQSRPGQYPQAAQASVSSASPSVPEVSQRWALQRR